jgi:hypothetical protein
LLSLLRKREDIALHGHRAVNVDVQRPGVVTWVVGAGVAHAVPVEVGLVRIGYQ